MSSPEISLVIATYNRAELLPRTLAALAAQQTATPYEVLFIDDGSTDATPDLIRAAAARHPMITYHRIGHSGSPGAPRNVGVERARGDIVVLIDDDVIVDPGFVEAHARFHRDHPATTDAALGELYLSEDVQSDPMSLFHTFPYDEVRRAESLSYLFFWTCNVSLKRTFLREHGRFAEDRALHPLEDMECGWRLQQAGMRLTFLPAATGCHVHKLLPASVLDKGRRTGQAQVALVARVPDVAVKVRFGILASDLPLPVLLRRLCNRVLFHLADTPPVHWVLRACGAESGTRSRVSDFYYYLVFRRGIFEGARRARAAAKASTTAVRTAGESPARQVEEVR